MSEYIISTEQINFFIDHMGENVSIPASVAHLNPIVRCRDCKHYKPYRTHSHGVMNRCEDENGNWHRRDENDFCSKGERRGE